MKIEDKNILYSFDVSIDKKVEVVVEKKKKQKNKETGKMEVIVSKENQTTTEETPYKMIIRKPTRMELEDGDMFYSVELNKFIKMGLLTKAMLAKQYGTNGGVWTEKEQKIYSELIYKMYQKELEVQQLSMINQSKISERQKEKLNAAMLEMSQIKKELTEYEMIQNSLFDHTADVKARNRAIMWYILHLASFIEGDSDDAVLEDMFEGEDFEEKYEAYENKEESEDELYKKTIDRISSIITIWYVSGSNQREELEKMMEEMKVEEDQESEKTEEAAVAE